MCLFFPRRKATAITLIAKGPSIVLQALVNDRCMIRDICVGTPGSAHYAAVFAASDLCKKAYHSIYVPVR